MPPQLNTFGQPISQFGGSIVPGEPSVLSSVSGEQNFQTKVQPKIDAANANVTASTTLKQDMEKVKNQTKAGYDLLGNKVDPLPADVAAEIDGGKTEEEKAYEARLSNWDKQETDAKNTMAGLSLAATNSAKAAIASLTSQWQERRTLLEKSNKANEANWTQQFIRFGQAEYSPGMTGDMISSKEQEGIARVKALDDDYNSKVADINTALDNKQFQLAAQLTSDLNSIEEKALTLMHDNAKEAQKVNDTIRQKQVQSSRDNAIAGLVAQGITDPTEIMSLLNESAKASGYDSGDFTAEEIDKALKVFKPDDALAGLDADLKTFTYLQKNQPDLVKGLDFFGYKNAVYNATHKADTSSSDAVNLPTSDKTKLLGAGFTNADISNIQRDVNAHGLDEVLNGISDERQKNALREVYGADDTTEFLTSDYLEKLFGEDGLKKAAADAGYRHLLTSWATEKQNYLDSIMNTIEQYRAANYTDKEILKMLQ